MTIKNPEADKVVGTAGEQSGGRYLCFSIGNEKFATPLSEVKEVLGTVESTPLPQAPPYFKGIINLRGQVISIIDLRLKLNPSRKDTGSQATTIIMDFAPLALGVIVDSVDCVSVFEQKDLSNAPDTNSEVRSEFIIGVARAEKSMTLILDLRAMLNTKDYQVMKIQHKQAA